MTFLAWVWGCAGAPVEEPAREEPATVPAAAPAAGPPHAHHHDDATVTHRFDDPARWSAVFDDPARDAWQKPAELVSALAIEPGQAVAAVGAGTGYFEPHLARAVGPTGKVLAIDVEPSLVEHLKARASKEGLSQVEVRLGTPEDPGLKPGEVDLVLLVDTYHHVSDRQAWFTRLAPALREGGRLVIVDFDPASKDEHGPPTEHRLPPEVVRAELEVAGWTVVEQPPILPHQYVLVLRRR